MFSGVVDVEERVIGLVIECDLRCASAERLPTSRTSTVYIHDWGPWGWATALVTTDHYSEHLFEH